MSITREQLEAIKKAADAAAEKLGELQKAVRAAVDADDDAHINVEAAQAYVEDVLDWTLDTEDHLNEQGE